MILEQSRNKEQQDLRLSTNLTSVFVLHITLPKVQNEDPFKIVFKLLEKSSKECPLLDCPKLIWIAAPSVYHVICRINSTESVHSY